MTMRTIINAITAWLAFGGVIVAFAFLPYTLKQIRTRTFTDRFWFALGISVGWFGTGINHVYLLAYSLRHECGPVSARGTFLWLFAALLVALGMVLHLRTVTRESYGEYLWIACVALICVGALIVSTFIDC
jgi:hypothetical protein